MIANVQKIYTYACYWGVKTRFCCYIRISVKIVFINANLTLIRIEKQNLYLKLEKDRIYLSNTTPSAIHLKMRSNANHRFRPSFVGVTI